MPLVNTFFSLSKLIKISLSLERTHSLTHHNSILSTFYCRFAGLDAMFKNLFGRDLDLEIENLLLLFESA